MPPWKRILKDEQINGVLDYVMQTIVKEPVKEPRTRNLPDKNPVAASPESIAGGERVFLLRCTGCHGRKADGKGPNSLDILPHPRNLRNQWFVESVPDRRLFESIEYGVQGTAMPSWIDQVSQHDVGDVVNFIRSLQNARK
jgi:mono/diheme cytochrome c family protein